jgi:hypothetical protein
MISFAAGGCTPPHMTVPPEVGQGTEEVHVEGRSSASGMFVNEDFKIGAYEVANVSRGGKHTSRFGAFGGFKSSSETGYSFDLKQGTTSLHGECLAGAGESGVSIGGTSISKQSENLGCACGNEKAPTASVVIAASTGNGYGGTLNAHDGTYQVKAIYEREGGISDGGPAGYRVDGQGISGAVDVLGPGRIWIAKSLNPEQRTDLTCVFAGLLLYKAPKN